MRDPIHILKMAMQKPAIFFGLLNMLPLFIFCDKSQSTALAQTLFTVIPLTIHMKPCSPKVNQAANRLEIRLSRVLKSGMLSAITNAMSHKPPVMAIHDNVATLPRLPMYFVPRKILTKRYCDATCPKMTYMSNVSCHPFISCGPTG